MAAGGSMTAVNPRRGSVNTGPDGVRQRQRPRPQALQSLNAAAGQKPLCSQSEQRLLPTSVSQNRTISSAAKITGPVRLPVRTASSRA